MSFKDLEEGKHPQRVETPEEAELRARAAARHKAKEARQAAKHAEQSAGKPQRAGGTPREDSTE
jgi:hypothetical protein